MTQFLPVIHLFKLFQLIINLIQQVQGGKSQATCPPTAAGTVTKEVLRAVLLQKPRTQTAEHHLQTNFSSLGSQWKFFEHVSPSVSKINTQ